MALLRPGLGWGGGSAAAVTPTACPQHTEWPWSAGVATGWVLYPVSAVSTCPSSTDEPGRKAKALAQGHDKTSGLESSPFPPRFQSSGLRLAFHSRPGDGKAALGPALGHAAQGVRSRPTVPCWGLLPVVRCPLRVRVPGPCSQHPGPSGFPGPTWPLPSDTLGGPVRPRGLVTVRTRVTLGCRNHCRNHELGDREWPHTMPPRTSRMEGQAGSQGTPGLLRVQAREWPYGLDLACPLKSHVPRGGLQGSDLLPRALTARRMDALGG